MHDDVHATALLMRVLDAYRNRLHMAERSRSIRLLPIAARLDVASGGDDYPAGGASRDRNSLIRSSSAMLKSS